MIRAPRRVLQLVLLALAALAITPALAAPPPQATAVTLAARPAYEGGFRPGTWMPIVVDVENTGVDRVVQVRAGTREGAQYAAQLDLPNGGRKSLTLYAYMTPASRRLVVRVLDGDQELASETLQLTPLNQRARVVGVLAGQGVAIRPPARLPGGQPVVAVPLAATDLPEHPLGLSGLHALVVEGAATSELRPAQREAIAAWVARGGLLVLGGGETLATTLAGLPEALRPAEATAVVGMSAAELLSGASAEASVPVATLAPRASPDGRRPYQVPLAGLTSSRTLAIEQSSGRGAAVALAFPLGHPALLAWEGAPALWGSLLRPLMELPTGAAPDGMTLDGFIESNLASTLTSLPALEFPPLGLLVALLVSYIVLIGPVTYLVLRRLDRQALGWVVVPAITLVFAALTYGLGYAQRGSDIVLNRVTLIETVDGAPGEARARTFVGLFSPERREYVLQVAGPEPDSAALLVRPISVQGPWDGGAPATAGVYMQGFDAEARAFEVPQWSLRALTVDGPARLPGLAVSLRVEGEKLIGEVVNGSPLSLRDIVVIQGDQLVRLGDLAPGEARSGELKRRGNQAGGAGMTAPVSYLIYGEEMDKQGIRGQPLSADLQRRIRVLDALYNYGPSPRGGQPLFFAWSDASTLRVTTEVERVDEQDLMLVTGSPRLEVEDGLVRLGQGWLAPRFEEGVASVCFGGQGAGLTLGAEPAVMQLSLPRDLYGLRASELRLLTASDGPWMNDTQVELYDWTSDTWVAQETNERTIVVEGPERFLGGHGVIRLRLTSGQGQPNFNCVYIDARIRGSLS